MKKLFSILTILSLVMGYSPFGAYAQSATSSSLLQSSATGSANINSLIQSIQQFPTPSSGNSSNSSPSGQVVPSVSLSSFVPPSANLEQPPYVLTLLNHNFRAGESVSFDVENVPADQVNVVVVNPYGKAVSNAVIEKTQEQALTTVLIHTPSAFRPGKYTVQISDSTGVISTQSFTWGVLAINVNKSIYLPGETADIEMAVLDEQGSMVCNADVVLTITAPNGTVSKLTTSNGSIVINPTCQVHAVTVVPDYEAHFTTSSVGTYSMSLTATTANGSYTISDGFQVRNSVPFDVERVAPTRIYPPDTYPVAIKIHANEDFTGKIVETVPDSFQISKATESGIINFSEQSSIPNSLGTAQNYGIPHLRMPFNGNYPVTLGFGQQIDDPAEADRYKKYGLDGHDGIDFGLPSGTPVVSVDKGVVILAQANWIYGTTVVIQHSWGRSYYGHLSVLEVTSGEVVSAGTEIGLSGATGLVTGPHLHFGIKPNNADINNLYYGKIDPAPFLGIQTQDPALYATNDYPTLSKALVWNVEVGKGADFTIGYNFKAPDTSPYLYTTGPLQFIGTTTAVQVQANFDVLNSTVTNLEQVATSSAGFNNATGSGILNNPFVLGISTGSADLAPSTNSGQMPATASPNLSTNIATPSATSIENYLSQGEGAPQVIFKEIRLWQIAADSTSFITSGTSWSVPSDWSTTSKIEVIGGGGGGANGSPNQGGSGAGGGGGGYSLISNTTALSAGATVMIAVGPGGIIGGNGGDTYLCKSNTLANCSSITGTDVIVGAKGGAGGSAQTGGTGGQATSGIGSTKYNGGNGGAGGSGSGSSGAWGGGGGGAAGLNAAGNAGTAGTSATASTGGQGDGTFGGAGGTAAPADGVGGNGGNGTEWDSTHGSGGGGAGGGEGSGHGSNGQNAGTAGSYGAAGGGGGSGGKASTSGGSGTAGYQGLIVITYTPAVTGPTLAQLMRHGQWFNNSGVRQPFTF